MTRRRADKLVAVDDKPEPTPRGQLSFIVNPLAGRRRGRVRDVLARLRRSAPQAEILITRAPGEAAAMALARRHDADRVLVAVGGDGTVHEVGGALIGAAAALGVLPIGSGNDFASMISTPDRVEQAAEFFTSRPPRCCDAGRVAWRKRDGASGQAAFVNSLGLGFEGVVARRAQSLARVPGVLRYLLAVARELPTYRSPHMQLSIDGSTFEGRQFLVAIGNGRRAGGGFMLNPAAAIDDAWLDVCRADDLPLHRLLRILPSVFQGEHLAHAGVHGGRCRVLTILSDPATPVHADGELLTDSAVEIKVTIVAAGLRLVG